MTYLQAAEKYIPEGREDILDRFIHNATEPLDREVEGDPIHFLECAFIWKNTPKGHDFWSIINSEILRQDRIYKQAV